MRIPSRVLASCTSLVPSWNHQTKIAHLVGRPTIQFYHATLFSAGFTVLRRGMHMMSESLTLLRCLARGSLQGEIQLCQK